MTCKKEHFVLGRTVGRIKNVIILLLFNIFTTFCENICTFTPQKVNKNHTSNFFTRFGTQLALKKAIL